MKYVGIDVGKYKCAVAMMDSEGRVSDEFTFHNNNEGIQGLISRLSIDDEVVMNLLVAFGQIYTIDLSRFT